MSDEIFGPIIPIYYYNDVSDINEILELNKNPLASYLFCDNWKEISDNIRSGSMVINDTLMQMCSPLPFGGVGNSGIGCYHGKYSFDTFTYNKAVLVRPKWVEIKVRFPPYNLDWKKWMAYLFSRYITLKPAKILMYCFLLYLGKKLIY